MIRDDIDSRLIDKLLAYLKLKGWDPSKKLTDEEERGLLAWLYNLIFGH